MNILVIFIVLTLRTEVIYSQTDSDKQLVKPGEFPFMASIGVHDSHRNCVGSVIHKNWVLTSCACGQVGEPLLIQFGEIQNQVQTEQLSPITEVLKHPNHGDIKNCVNLIRLKNPIKYDRFTQAVKLVPKGKQLPINSNAVAIAWSLDNDLQLYNITVEETDRPGLIKTAGKLVFRSSTPGTPLIYDGYQVGVFTFLSDNILYYTDVTLQLDWIHKTVNFYEFKEKFSYLKSIDPNCSTTIDSYNDVLDICCTYPFGHDLIDICSTME